MPPTGPRDKEGEVIVNKSDADGTLVRATAESISADNLAGLKNSADNIKVENNNIVNDMPSPTSASNTASAARGFGRIDAATLIRIEAMESQIEDLPAINERLK